MKRIFFIICLLFTNISWAQCLRDSELNKVAEEELKVSCQEFPPLIELNDLQVETNNDVTLYAEDMIRLNVAYLTVKGLEKEIVVHIEGEVRFLSKMYGFFVGDNISAIDESQGKLDLSTFSYIYARNFPKLQDRIGVRRRNSLAIVSRANETIDFNNAELEGMFTIHNAGRIQNVKIRGANYVQLLSSNPTPTIVSNMDYETQVLLLNNVEFYPMDKICKADSFRFQNTIVKSPGLRLTNSESFNFDINNSKIHFVGPNFLPINYGDIESSEITGAILSVLDETKEITIRNSTVTLDKFPSSSEMEKVNLAGNINILYPHMPLKITEKMQTLRLIEMDLSQMTLDIVNPARLMILDFTGSKSKDLQILHPENGKLVPGVFSAHANDKTSQGKLRKLFRTKAVSNESWLPL